MSAIVAQQRLRDGSAGLRAARFGCGPEPRAPGAGYFLTVFILAAARLSAAETVAFVPAEPNPLIGDWDGGSQVAQVFMSEGKWQANLLRAFDEPDAKPIAVLTGVATPMGLAFRGGGWTGKIEGDRFTAARPGASIEFHHVTRTPPTLGAKPPPGATILFDGGSLDHWVTKSGKDWLKPSGPAKWKLVPGHAMEVVPGADSLLSRDIFGDARVHLEFRTLGAPTNSGIYLQTRYEVNINETYGKTEGTPNAGLDNCSDVKPRIRASRPPLEWQTLDIDFAAPRFDPAGTKSAPARATVRLNGVTLYENQPLNPPKGAAGRLGEAPTGPLLLQEHGMPVQFRNIWVQPR